MRLANEEPEATRIHEERLLQPEVVKRKAKDPGNVAKSAATAKMAAARPADAPANSRPCPYCKKWMPHTHPENCPQMPYDFWIEATRQRNIAKHGADVVNKWSTQCQHCATAFPSPASKRVHLSGRERRRNEAGLPLNLHPVVRRV